MMMIICQGSSKTTRLIIINAAMHCDYSIKSTDIQLKMFDDRIVVESPENLSGIVRLNNMRQVHFSRNPKIAAFLHEYDYVQEFGEGVDRMYKEMEKAGLPAPEYKDVACIPPFSTVIICPTLCKTAPNTLHIHKYLSGMIFSKPASRPDIKMRPLHCT